MWVAIMEKWLNCWSCTHDTLQNRMYYVNHYRLQNLFNKNDDGAVCEDLIMPMISTHGFYICKKCSAPNYYIHEYYPIEKDTDTFEEESLEIRKAFETCGEWRKDKLFNIYHYPSFSVEPYPSWTKELPEDLMRLTWEVYTARKQGMYTLAMMGIRTIIDKFATDKVGDVGGFAQKLKKLVKEGFISQQQKNILETLVEAGSAAAHRGFMPTAEQVQECFSTLEALFFFEIKNKEIDLLNLNIPSRT